MRDKRNGSGDARRVKRLGREAGFDLVRIASAGDLVEEGAHFQRWIGDGRQAQMRWITPAFAERASSPGGVLEGARSVISVALSYWAGLRPADSPGTGRIARYAWGRDYHAVLGERLGALADRLRAEFGGDHRWYVDTGPLMDKALAARAGLGWYGKNTNILTERLGSFVLLGEIVTTLDLEPDRPLRKDCGHCRLCVVACPTGALGPDYSIDSRRCISYLTIEHREAIPLELRPLIGRWVFGCDICQDVCPPAVEPYLRTSEERHTWAAQSRSYLKAVDLPSSGDGDGESAPQHNPLFEAGIRPEVDLLWLLGLTHEGYLEAFRGTSIRRAKVWMLRRNAAVALGNVGDPACREHLWRSLATDEHPLVRGHAAWALGQIARRHSLADVRHRLAAHLEHEEDEGVREEIRAAAQF